MPNLSLNFVVFMAIMVTSMQFFGTMAQTRHVVGDVLGWTIPPNGAATYTAWASRQTFIVGDTLVFNFTNGLHDVAEVSEAAYDPCTSANPISLATSGPASLTLITPGTHYYICTFTSHCQIGQKLTINVSATGTTTPSLTPASPPTTSPAPTLETPLTPSLPCPPTSSPSSNPFSPPTTTSSSITPALPPSTGASSITAVLPAAATFLAIGFAFFNY